MKILFLIRALTVGGAQRQLITVANGLADIGEEISIVVFYGGGQLEKTLGDRVQVFNLDKQGRWDTVSFFIKMRALLKAYEPDVLYSYLESANIVSAVMKLFVADLKVVWGKRSAYLFLADYGLVARLVFFFERKLAVFADCILFNSDYAQKLYLEAGYLQRTNVIVNGFDEKKFQFDNVGRVNFRGELGVESGQYLIGMVGRIDPIKNHSLFLHVAERIKLIDRTARFVIVGSGDEAFLFELISLAKKLDLEDRLVWVEEREDMAEVYSALDVLVSASHGESFPNVVGEAMLCGTPCVVTDVGASAQVVDRFGKVIPVQSESQMVNAVFTLKEESNVLNRAKIRQHIVDNYSVIQLVEKTKTVFSTLLDS